MHNSFMHKCKMLCNAMMLIALEVDDCKRKTSFLTFFFLPAFRSIGFVMISGGIVLTIFAKSSIANVRLDSKNASGSPFMNLFREKCSYSLRCFAVLILATTEINGNTGGNWVDWLSFYMHGTPKIIKIP